MVSLRKLSMCTISSSPQKTTTATTTTTTKRELLFNWRDDKTFYSNLYKHCQISVTHTIMVELRCF